MTLCIEAIYQMKPAEEEGEEDVGVIYIWVPMDPPDNTVVHITDNTSTTG